MASKKSVLIFGAYGNGNMGDEIQANSLAAAIKAHSADINVSAASYLSKSDFGFKYGDTLSNSELMDPDFINGFNLLLIGGGGLLAHPHYPLANADWVGGIKTPIALWGVGATNFFALDAAEIIKQSVFASARDIVSLKTINDIRKDVVMVIDPVLADRGLVSDVKFSPSSGVAWIVAGPRTELHEQIALRLSSKDSVLAFEESVDSELIEIFPEMKFVHTAEDFFLAVSGRRVVSMRYHGVILGILAGVPVVSLLRPKGKDLLEMFGVGECGVNSLSSIPGNWASQDLRRTAKILEWNRLVSEHHMGRLLKSYVFNS